MGNDSYAEAMRLLNMWEKVNKENAKNSREKAISLKGGLDVKIKIKDNAVVIYDYKTTKMQQQIQKELTSIFPERYASIIASKPAIMDFDWKVNDYLELYFNHYRVVIEKLKGIIENLICQTQK